MLVNSDQHLQLRASRIYLFLSSIQKKVQLQYTVAVEPNIDWSPYTMME